MRKNKSEKSWDIEVMEKFPMLYCQHDKTMQETCMCFGFENGPGWKESLVKLSAKLETLNMLFYPKYKVRIQVDQVKEKYGKLHFYYSVVTDGPWYERLCRKVSHMLFNKLKTFDYKLVYVVDVEPYVETQKKVFDSKVAYLEDKYAFGKCFNVKYAEEDGKFVKYTDIQHYKKTHSEPTKHKFLYKLLCLARRMRNYSTYKEHTYEQYIIEQFLDSMAYKYIEEAENECYNTCEECGTQIGTKYSPRCETTGWIKYICDKCAKKHGNYYKNGELYDDDKCIKTKNELEQERLELERKFAEADAQYEKEKEEFERELAEAKKEEQ